jgi:DNA-directed RNA polymerase subunit RPC12/RpoP
LELLHLAGVGAIARKNENVGFACVNCGAAVAPLQNGSYRNHCPFCLYSRHVDGRPGDRASSCRGLMEPVGIEFRSGKGFMVEHRCVRCGFVRPNRVAPDDTEAVIALMRRG